MFLSIKASTAPSPQRQKKAFTAFVQAAILKRSVSASCLSELFTLEYLGSGRGGGGGVRSAGRTSRTVFDRCVLLMEPVTPTCYTTARLGLFRLRLRRI